MSCARPNTPRSDPKSVLELVDPLQDRIHTAIIDAPTKGLVLNSGYRDPGRQWDLRRDRCPGRECDKSCKGNPVTALPAQIINGQYVGGSLHQHRKAADMAGRDLGWLIANRFRYGLVLTVKSENWHFEAHPGARDSRTGRLVPQPSVRIVPIGQAAVPLPPKRPNILRYGMSGPFVLWYQALLAEQAKRNPKVKHPGKPDGKFGKATRESARTFEQQWNVFLSAFQPHARHLQVDGILTVPSMDALEWASKH